MTKPSLGDLEQRDDFIRRHIGPGDEQIAEMLGVLGLDSLEQLIEKVVPKSIITDQALNIGADQPERGTLSYLRRMSERNKVFISMIGMGYYGTKMPSVILRNVRDAIAVCPPLIITEDEIEELLQGLHRALDDGLDHARKNGWV